ncbi:ATP-binding cassette domain-containing protein [Clostridium sp. YIM B02505]|uniref:ATP-binding cassette domain-containing protein n=1 Tax=Clostridium yunnanense TaxID=2800325 RepID=A0ABS1EVR2_9CLOT|nr:ATP-binding cassette domain-containing protein [Clostridium yunnanense]MBK1813467.1 ATP-binding cassette domain-containing protein [Clostridium yunnanense]
MVYALRTFNLTKEFKNKTIVDNLSINIKKGEIYGFLGENGSGKTTTIKLIVNLLKPTSGSIEFFGEPINLNRFEVFKRIGSVIETPAFYETLTARENLEIHKTLMGYEDKDCIQNALDMVKLDNFEGKLVKEFSLGMKQRLGIARAILTKPEFLMLDEPINGLDPIGIKHIRDLLITLSKKHGITILISSHILSEIEQLADTIGIIHKGKLLEEIDYATIQSKNKHSIEITVNDVKKAAFLLTEKLHINNFVVDGIDKIRIYERLDNSSIINKVLISNDVEVISLTTRKDSLEDHFISLIGGTKNA